MITDFLLDHRELTPVVFLLLALVVAGVGFLLARRPRPLWTLVAVSLVPVFTLTFSRAGARVDVVMCTVQFVLPSPGSVELLANVALFLPSALLATVASRRPVVVAVAASALSAAIETVQAVVPSFGRACDTNDWLMNTAGAVLGVLLGAGILAVVRRADRRGGVASR